MKVIYKSKISKYIFKADAMVLYPFILFSHSKDRMIKYPNELRKLFRHEWEHVIQVRKEGWIKFYLNYIFQFFTKGYKNISWEIEARKAASTAMPRECKILFEKEFPELRGKYE